MERLRDRDRNSCGNLLRLSQDDKSHVLCIENAGIGIYNSISSSNKMMRTYIWSILLYEVETWTLKIASVNRLEAFEM